MLTLKAMTLIYLRSIPQAECFCVPVLLVIIRKKAHYEWVPICAVSEKICSSQKGWSASNCILTFRKIHAGLEIFLNNLWNCFLEQILCMIKMQNIYVVLRQQVLSHTLKYFDPIDREVKTECWALQTLSNRVWSSRFWKCLPPLVYSLKETLKQS